jgi:hypothetical protein
LGADVKFAKSGKVHTINFGPAAPSFSGDLIDGLMNLNPRKLELADCAVSDIELAALAASSNLDHLDLRNTRVSDASISVLKTMGHLRFLVLTGSQVSRDGIADLRKAMLTTRIIYL